MSRLQQGKIQSRYVWIRKDYHSIISRLGLKAGGEGETEIIEAVIFAIQQRGEDLRAVYEQVARLNVTTVEDIESKIAVALKNNNTELSSKYGEATAPYLRNLYFGDEYADLSDPKTFIFGLTRYIKAHR